LVITTKQVIRLGITNFDTSTLPAELLDRVLSSINAGAFLLNREKRQALIWIFQETAWQSLRRTQADPGMESSEDLENVTPRALSAECFDILFATETDGLGRRTADQIIPFLVAGSEENPDWRTRREILIMLVGAMAGAARSCIPFHLESH